MPILETKNLSKQFDGVHAVDHLSIAIQPGTITSIIGPNGSGKTTLINLLSGLLRQSSGTMVIGETTEIEKLKPYDLPTHGLTRTFQEVRLFNQMSALDNVLVVLTDKHVFSSLFEKHGESHLKKAEELLTKVGLWDKRDEQAGNLSYGQRKLLEIARALAMDTNIYLFDEPFAGLFPHMIRTVAGILKNLRQTGKTVILIEHNMDLIRELSDYVFVMDAGKLLAEGKPNEVLKQREVIEAYLGD